MKIVHSCISGALRLTAWASAGRTYNSPLRPDRILRVDPTNIERKITEAPSSRRISPSLVVDGDWDLRLEPIREDIVFETFQSRFIDGHPWEETGYIEYLSGNDSEHGGLSREEAMRRCEAIDELYEYISEEGVKTQKQLEEDGALITELTTSFRPPAYREIAIDITRDGEMVWHAGMHRLVIAKLLDVEPIPVRVHTRHKEWQEVRETASITGNAEDVEDHPDIEYLLQTP